MTDRMVRQLVPKVDESTQRQRFSAFSDVPNLVLLGAPGAGKTHLFTEAAASGGKRVTTRDFLNIPSFPEDAVLFIDALDESRAGRGDQSTINAVVKKLFDVKPKKVRIACRESDWLGETDLATFQAYFDSTGATVVVVALERLTVDEQRLVLRSQGVVSPDDFLRHAVERGLEDMLVNPQNLVMLSKAVGDGEWPRNRTELFRKATDILLAEHNQSRARSGDGVFSANELREPAGAIFAARLISDVGGVSLTEDQVSDDYPTYRSVPYSDIEKVRSALGRRIFIGNGEESADYTHRTTAEFLGADWLARQITSGLPIGRVRALLGVEGHPTSELRGLHAWLAVLCPSEANELIDADPYGVLTYGDAATLSVSHRKRLLAAIGRLSEVDPWFNRSSDVAPNIGALASKDLVPSFRSILRSTDAKFTLKKLVLSALAKGSPLQGIEGDLVRILKNIHEPYGLRSLALDALVNMGPSGISTIGRVFSKLGKLEPDIRLRAEIIGQIYGQLSTVDVIQILNDAMDCKTDLPGGVLWFIADAIPPQDAPSIVAGIDDRSDRGLSGDVTRVERHNVHDVGTAVSRLIVRYLNASTEPISANVLWPMLARHRSLNKYRNHSGGEGIRNELLLRPDVLQDLFTIALDEVDEAVLNFRFLYAFREATVKAVDDADLVQWLTARVISAADSQEKQALFYEVAIQLAISADNQTLFDQLYLFGATRADLLLVRDRNLTSVVEDWRREDAVTQAEEALASEASKANAIRLFERDITSIRDATHRGWMEWLGRTYFCAHDGLASEPSSHIALASRLGSSNLSAALEGLRSFVDQTNLPTVDDVARAVVKNSYPVIWYAVIAGMDERWSLAPSLSGLSDDLLKTLVAVKLVMHTERRDGNRVTKIEHPWLEEILTKRCDLASEVYFRIASKALLKKAPIASGLSELLSNELLSSHRQENIRKLLLKHFSAPVDKLEQILTVALTLPEASNEWTVAAKRALDRKEKLNKTQQGLWLATAFLIDPGSYRKAVEAAGRKPDIFWQLKSLSKAADLNVAQIETILKIGSKHFPETPHPTGAVWGGSTNPWDGSEYIHKLIDQVSNIETVEASNMLKRILKLPSFDTYSDAIKHSLAAQATRRREAVYRQPNWIQAVSALANGAPANHADLHALVLDHCEDLNKEITNSNTDIYKQFWNEGSYGRVSTPRSEETSRDVLVGMLRARLRAHKVSVEPEGHMAADKRVDISVAFDLRKTMMEWKRDYHPDVWHAHSSQLDRLYTPDPDASGYGIYGVFWFGVRRPRAMRLRPDEGVQPQSAAEMQAILAPMIPADKRERLRVIVLDVSGPGAATTKGRGGKRKAKT